MSLKLHYMHNLHPGANLHPDAKLHPGANLLLFCNVHMSIKCVHIYLDLTFKHTTNPSVVKTVKIASSRKYHARKMQTAVGLAGVAAALSKETTVQPRVVETNCPPLIIIIIIIWIYNNNRNHVTEWFSLTSLSNISNFFV